MSRGVISVNFTRSLTSQVILGNSSKIFDMYVEGCGSTRPRRPDLVPSSYGESRSGVSVKVESPRDPSSGRKPTEPLIQCNSKTKIEFKR